MLNKVTLIGNLGADVELRYLPNGSAVATLSVATTRKWKDKQTNEKREETEWHRVTLFQKLAEIAGQYLKKGSKVYLEGRIKTTKYQKDGVDHYSTGIIADQMIMLDGKQADGSAQPQQRAEPPKGNSTAPSYDDFDDDIPF